MTSKSGTSAAINITQESLLTILKRAKQTHQLLEVALKTLPPAATLLAAESATAVIETRTLLEQAISALERPNPDANGRFWWLVAIGLSTNLVEDGADLTARRMHEIMSKAYPYAITAEISIKIISRPDKADD